MSMIDERRSRANQARRDPIVADSVDRFANALRQGATFPPIVVYPCGGKVVIIDGNNRHAAARRVGVPHIRGIVVADTTPSETILLLTVEANARHGVTPDTSWRVQQAFHLVSMGFTDQQAADATALSLASLRTARAVRDADQRARAMRINGFENLAQAARQRLGALKDDAVFYQAAKVAIDTGMSSDELSHMVREVKALGSEAERIEHIGRLARTRGLEQAARKAMRRGATRINSPKTSLVAGIGKMLAVDDAALVRQVLTTTDRDALKTRLEQADLKIKQLMLALATLTDLDEPI